MQFDFQLSRNAFGHLLLTTAAGEVCEGVIPVRAFPIAAPDQGISLVSSDGRELAWIERMDDVPTAMRQLIDEELSAREFMPEIRRLHSVSTFATPSTWAVLTDRGETSFVLRGEEDIRRVHGGSLLIADSHGIQFLIRRLEDLDRHSRRLLDRFL